MTKVYNPLVFFLIALVLALLVVFIVELVKYRDTQKGLSTESVENAALVESTALAEGVPLSLEGKSPYMSMGRFTNLFLKALLFALLMVSIYMLVPAEHWEEIHRQERESLILKYMIRNS